MTDQHKRLCSQLLRADSEEVVINILREAGYWNRSEFWRYYGGVENNWGQSGNQQSLAEAALARLIRETARLSPDFERAGGVVQRLCGAGA